MNIFDVLNLNYSGLEKVKELYEANKFGEAKKEIKKYFCNRISIRGFLDDKQEIIKYANDNLDEYIRKVIDISQEVARKEFRFISPWEMERCNSIIKFDNKIYWSLNPNNDNEWTFMLNRHGFLPALAQSYLFTNDKKYLSVIEYLLKDWIKNNKDKEKLKNTTWRTIESGIRIKNWTKALEVMFLSGEIDEELLCKVLVSINEHLVYLHDANKYERILSNWVILEQQGAFIAESFFPELNVSEVYKKEAIKTLEEAIELQVVEDGFHWEQSFQYHNEMLRCFFEFIILLENNNLEVSEFVRNKVKDMVYATLYSMKPNHCQSNYGDSDEEDLRDLMNMGAIIFKDSILRNYGNERIDLTTLLTCGYKGKSIFDSLDKRKLNVKCRAFNDVGLYFMRDGYNNDSSYSMFKCGFLGSGHGHSDMLHTDITCMGEDILIDSGRFTYSPSKSERIELKKPKSHNTTIINDLDFTVCTSSWSNSSVATPIKGSYKFKENSCFVEGGHLGYVNSNKPTFVNRKFIFIKPNIWVISDEFLTNDENKYTQFYNFNKPNVSKINNNKLKYFGDKINFTINILRDGGELFLEDSIVSKDYNQKYKSTRAVFNLNNKGNTFITTVMYGKNIVNDEEAIIKYLEVYDWQGKKISSSIGEAISIEVNNEKYIVLLIHIDEPNGRKLYIVDGHRVYGRVAVIKEKENVEVLAY
ncbi:MAG: heparinase II/III family protein [Clostridium celatum]|nr:heparinase II/III family protein [Clostridium celatum]